MHVSAIKHIAFFPSFIIVLFKYSDIVRLMMSLHSMTVK